MIFSKEKPELVITATNSITSVGHDAYMTAGSVNARVAMIKEWESYYDSEDNPIVISAIDGISGKKSQEEFMYEVNEKCFNDLVEDYFSNGTTNEIHILLGIPHENSPSKKTDKKWEEHKKKLIDKVSEYSEKVKFSAFYFGNPSAIYALKHAALAVSKNENISFVIGSFDSLLNKPVLDYLNNQRRLKSVSYGRNHGLIASHGSGFFVAETKKYAAKYSKNVLAQIKGIGIEEEPSPLTSGNASRYSGLSSAVNKTLKENKLSKNDINTVFSDLNGEYFRSKEWSYTAVRCFNNTEYELIHPADCFGSIGAASGSVLTNLASIYLSEEWIEKDALVVCSDDYGPCGSLILGKYEE